jgi:hypothetical protein
LFRGVLAIVLLSPPATFNPPQHTAAKMAEFASLVKEPFAWHFVFGVT